MKLRIFFFIMFLIIGSIAVILVSLVSMRILDENVFGKIGLALLFFSLLLLYLAYRGDIPEEENTKAYHKKGKKKSRVIQSTLVLDNNRSIEIIDYLNEQIMSSGYTSIEYRMNTKDVELLEYYRLSPDKSSVMMIVILYGKTINERIIEQCIQDQERVYKDNNAVNETNRKHMIMLLVPNKYDKTVESYIENGTIIDYATSIITAGIDNDTRQVFISPNDYTGTRKWKGSVKELRRVIPTKQMENS